MSSVARSRRCSKRYGKNLKASLIVDINTPPSVPQTRQAEETSTAAEATTSEPNARPIDVDAIEDDDVQMLSSPRLRTKAVMVVLDEDLDFCSRKPDDPHTSVSLNIFSEHRKHSSKRVVINCEAYVNVEDDHFVKRKKARNPRNEQEMVPPKEPLPLLSCPICMGSLINACSTICGHVFCQACIKKALQAQKKCPTCRKKLTASSFHRVFLSTST